MVTACVRIVDATFAVSTTFELIETMLWLRTVLLVACTKAVVASCVVEVPGAAVGAVGTSVKAGEARGAAPVTWATA
jgi:hypothetical protein